MGSSFAVKTSEPLALVGEHSKVTTLLPSGTVLYHEKSWPEGHTTYKAYFHFKGALASEPFDPKVLSPSWLYTLDKEDVMKLMQEYPLTLGELRKLLKARKVTREEYIQILRDWEDPGDDKEIGSPDSAS